MSTEIELPASLGSSEPAQSDQGSRAINDSALPRPTTVDAQVTLDELERGFELTSQQPALHARAVFAAEDEKFSGFDMRETLTNLSRDGVGVLIAGSGAVEVDRRLRPVTDPVLPDYAVAGQNREVSFVLAQGVYWVKEVDQTWRTGLDAHQVIVGLPREQFTNAYRYVDHVRSAISGPPISTSVLPDGARRVSVHFDADIIGALAFTTIMTGDVGGTVTGFIEMSNDGRIRYAEADVLTWYNRVFEEDEFSDRVADTARFSVAFAPVNGELVVQAPCSNETTNPDCG